MSIDRLTLTNILSFGPGGCAVDLGPLNVLIGPNGSGKSNLIDVIGLLQQSPVDLSAPIRDGGGIEDWFWKGEGQNRYSPSGQIAVRIADYFGTNDHEISIGARQGRVWVSEERVSNSESPPKWVYERHWRKQPAEPDTTTPTVPDRPNDSALSYRRDLREVAALADEYSAFRIYRDLQTGRNSPLRTPQRADLPDDYLMPGGENLGLILSALQRYPRVSDALQAAMREFHPSFHEVKTIVQGGTVQTFIREMGLNKLVPAARLSDGTLRYLALLCVLLHPKPPTVVAIEEPELGLHPDLIGHLAKHLVDASTRTQLIVTTHSDHLINALSDRPESVLVTSRDEQGTHFERLDAEKLKWWLERYSLGELWLKGEIGGTRW